MSKKTDAESKVLLQEMKKMGIKGEVLLLNKISLQQKVKTTLEKRRREIVKMQKWIDAKTIIRLTEIFVGKKIRIGTEEIVCKKIMSFSENHFIVEDESGAGYYIFADTEIELV